MTGDGERFVMGRSLVGVMYYLLMSRVFNRKAHKTLRQNLRVGMPIAERILWSLLKGKKRGINLDASMGLGIMWWIFIVRS